MLDQCVEEILANELGQVCAQSWIEDEIRKKGMYRKRGFNAELAKVTGLSLSYVGKVLTGKARVTPSFLTAFGGYLGISEQEVEASIGVKFDSFDKTTKELFVDNGSNNKFKKFVETKFPDRGLATEKLNRFAATSLEEIFPPPFSEKQLKADISNYFAYCDEECTDDLRLGETMSDILFHLPYLARHEVLELLHQIWKLRYNRSDSLAVQVADEDFAHYGIKPTTRLKLERIPVKPDGDKQEK